MSIKEIFRTRADSQAELVKKYQKLKLEKSELELKASELKERALDADVDDLTDKLQKINLQIELCDSACSQVEKQLATMIERDVQRKYESLDAEKQEYESQLRNLSQQAGQELGQAIKSLQSTDLSFATTLGRFIQEQVLDFSNDHRRKGQMAEFLIGYGGAINSQNGDGISFRDWRKRLAKVEQLRPGSPEAGRHVAARVKNLISA